MTLLWPTNGNIPAGSPNLHALVIGVSQYQHLQGGAGPLALNPLGLRQVTCPEPTAIRIANWLVTQYNNPACPLGSVEILVSPQGNKTIGPVANANIQEASLANIVQAVQQWWARCNSHPDNIALFYYVGHGIARVNQYLLPSDFGDPRIPGNPYANCVDFDSMALGMRTAAAKTQLFFLDACRETPPGILSQVNMVGNPILGGATFANTVPCSAVYYATSQGQQAFGPAGQPTYFSEAVVDCLDGLGTTNSGGAWQVSTSSLARALSDVMDHLGRMHGLPLSCSVNAQGRTNVHRPPAPKVRVCLQCTSPAANNSAEIELSQGATSIKSLAGQNKPLLQDVAPGTWSIDVRFPNGGFGNFAAQNEMLVPPLYEGVPIP